MKITQKGSQDFTDQKFKLVAATDSVTKQD